MEYLLLAMEYLTSLLLEGTSILSFVQKTKKTDMDVHLGQSVEYLPVVLGFQVRTRKCVKNAMEYLASLN